MSTFDSVANDRNGLQIHDNEIFTENQNPESIGYVRITTITRLGNTFTQTTVEPVQKKREDVRNPSANPSSLDFILVLNSLGDNGDYSLREFCVNN